MKCFTDEPHLWHNTSSKIDECTDSAAKGWVFSKRIGVFGDSIRLESIPVYSFQFILLKLRYTLSRTIIVSYYRDSRLPRFFCASRTPIPVNSNRLTTHRSYRSSNHVDFYILSYVFLISSSFPTFSLSDPIPEIRCPWMNLLPWIEFITMRLIIKCINSSNVSCNNHLSKSNLKNLISE